MALSLLLRRSATLQGVPALVKRGPIVVTNNTCFSQLFPKKSGLINTQNQLKLALTNNASKRFMSADHGRLWAIEKAFSAGLLAIVPAAIMFPNQGLDQLLALTTVLHFHWGFEAIVLDYIRPILFGPVIPKIALGLLYAFSATVLGGLFYYNYADIGIGRTIRKVWAIKN